METWYKVCRATWNNKVEEKDFERSTDKSLFYVGGRRIAIESNYDMWFKTKKEAVNFKLQFLKQRIVLLQERFNNVSEKYNEFFDAYKEYID